MWRPQWRPKRYNGFPLISIAGKGDVCLAHFDDILASQQHEASIKRKDLSHPRDRAVRSPSAIFAGRSLLENKRPDNHDFRPAIIMTASVAERRIKKELQKLRNSGDELGMAVEVGSTPKEWVVTIVGTNAHMLRDSHRETVNLHSPRL